MNAIEIRGLEKHFGKTRAVDGLDMLVRKGSVHGFLGPNGAGKSTTVRCVMGFIHPNAGSIKVLGHNPVSEPAAATARVSYVAGDVELWPQLTGAKTLATLAKLRPSGDDIGRRKELIERFDLDPSKKVRALSTGNRQKVALIAALAANVDLMVLDEPTAGLDPLMEKVFIECVREATERGVSVLLSSHILSEVQQVADAITIIRDGRAIESGSLQELSHLRGHRLQAVMPDGSRIDEVVDGSDINGRLRSLLEAGAEDIISEPSSLEDIFLSHYEGDSVAPRAAQPDTARSAANPSGKAADLPPSIKK